MTGLRVVAHLADNGEPLSTGWVAAYAPNTKATPLVSLPAVVEALEEVLAHEADGRPNTGYRLLKTLAEQLRALKESA